MNRKLSQLADLYQEERVLRKTSPVQRIQPFSSEDFQAIPLEFRATVRDIYSTDILSDHLDPEQNQKLSNFLFKNPSILYKLGSAGDFKHSLQGSVTVESVTELQEEYNKHKHSWRANPLSALRYIPESQKSSAIARTRQFLERFDIPPNSETPGFLKRKISRKTNQLIMDQTHKLTSTEDESTQESTTPTLTELWIEAQDTPHIEEIVEEERGGNSPEPEVESQVEMEEDTQSDSACNLPELDLGDFLAPSDPMTNQELYEAQQELKDLLESGPSSALPPACKPCLDKGEKDKTRDNIFTSVRRKAGKQLQEIKDNFRQSQKEDPAIFPALLDMFNKVNYEEVTSEEYQETISQASRTHLPDLMAAFVTASLLKNKEVEERLMNIEVAQAEVRQEILDLALSFPNLVAANAGIQEQLTTIQAGIGSVFCKIRGIEEEMIKSQSRTQRVEVSPALYLAQPVVKDGKKDIRSDQPMRDNSSNVPKSLLMTGNVRPKKLTPLERARLALRQDKPRSPSPQIPASDCVVPNLTQPQKPAPKLDIPGIPTAQMIANVKVSENPHSPNAGISEPTTVKDAKKGGLPISKFIENMEVTKKIDLGTLKKLIEVMRKGNKINASYISFIDKNGSWLQKWSECNPPSSDIYGDLPLLQTFDQALLYLSAIQDIIEKM